jgi:hypothetical protein
VRALEIVGQIHVHVESGDGVLLAAAAVADFNRMANILDAHLVDRQRRVSALFCTSGIWTTEHMAAEFIIDGFMQSSQQRAMGARLCSRSVSSRRSRQARLVQIHGWDQKLDR